MSVTNPSKLEQAYFATKALAALTTEKNPPWIPHRGQVEALSGILGKGKKKVVLEWGRRAGKSEVVCAILWLWAKLHKGSKSYYFAPTLNLADEIMWAPNRIQTFGPQDWIKDILKNEKRIIWKGREMSYVKLYGAEDYDKKRGIEPSNGLLILDEYAEFPEGFYDTLEPSLAKFDSPVIVISTSPKNPTSRNNPDKPHPFIQFADEARFDKKYGFYSNYSTYINPAIPTSFLNRKRDEYERRGELYIFEREYMARRVYGGANSIFPMLNRDDHFLGHEPLMRIVDKDRNQLKWYCIADPGTRTCFAMLFIAYNPYTGEVFYLDEIYERNQYKNTVSQIWPRADAIILDLHPWREDWNLVYDEAALWFFQEWHERYYRNGPWEDAGTCFRPTHKKAQKREPSETRPGANLMKDILLQHKAKLSSRCRYFFWEMENYTVDKVNDDHLVDSNMYFLQESRYSLVEKPVPLMKLNGPTSRFETERVFNVGSEEFEERFYKGVNEDVYIGDY